MLLLLFVQLKGSEIPDTRLQREKQGAVEVKILFTECVSETVHKWREKLVNLDKVDAKRQQGLQKRVNRVVSSRIDGFYDIAESAAMGLLAILDEACPESLRPVENSSFYRQTLKQSLLCISDCARYTLDEKRARACADLARFLVPEDVQTHAKFANLAFKGTEILEGQDLQALFNYLLEYSTTASAANSYRQAGVLFTSFVKHVDNEEERARGHSSRRSRSMKYRFSCAFIRLVWAIITEADTDSLSNKVRDESPCLWDNLKACLTEAPGHVDFFKDDDLFHVIGSVIFVLHCVTPQKKVEGYCPTPRMLAATFFIHGLVTALCERTETEFNGLGEAVKRRKRNRTRLMQKKNKRLPPPHGHAPSMGDRPEILLRLECYSSVYERLRPSAALGALSFLTHFLSKSLSITSDCHLALFKDLHDSVKKTRSAIEKFVSAGCFTPIFGLAATSVVESRKDQALLPQLDEDVVLSSVFPCRGCGMFGRIQEQSVSVDKMLRDSDGSCSVRCALQALEEVPYPVQIRGIATKHLDAFAARLVSGVIPGKNVSSYGSIDSRAVGDLVGIALRNQRLWRIEKFLGEFGGGRIRRCSKPGALSERNNRNGEKLQTFPHGRADDICERDVVVRQGHASELQHPVDVSGAGPVALGTSAGKYDSAALAPHKRRRLAAALTQPGDGSSGEEPTPVRALDNDVEMGGSDSPVISPSPVVAPRTKSISLRCNEQAPVTTPIKSFPSGAGTPLTLGQRPDHVDFDTPVVGTRGVVREPISERQRRPSMSAAVDAVLYGSPLRGRLSSTRGTWRWWQHQTAAAANPGLGPMWLSNFSGRS